jgi:PAS domain-containing protein
MPRSGQGVGAKDGLPPLRAGDWLSRALLDAAEDAIVLVQGERVVECNAAALRLFGGTRRAARGAVPPSLLAA